jgi:hypothetical protein
MRCESINRDEAFTAGAALGGANARHDGSAFASDSRIRLARAPAMISATAAMRGGSGASGCAMFCSGGETTTSVVMAYASGGT